MYSLQTFSAWPATMGSPLPGFQGAGESRVPAPVAPSYAYSPAVALQAQYALPMPEGRDAALAGYRFSSADPQLPAPQLMALPRADIGPEGHGETLRFLCSLHQEGRTDLAVVSGHSRQALPSLIAELQGGQSREFLASGMKGAVWVEQHEGEDCLVFDLQNEHGFSATHMVRLHQIDLTDSTARVLDQMTQLDESVRRHQRQAQADAPAERPGQTAPGHARPAGGLALACADGATEAGAALTLLDACQRHRQTMETFNGQTEATLEQAQRLAEKAVDRRSYEQQRLFLQKQGQEWQGQTFASGSYEAVSAGLELLRKRAAEELSPWMLDGAGTAADGAHDAARSAVSNGWGGPAGGASFAAPGAGSAGPGTGPGLVADDGRPEVPPPRLMPRRPPHGDVAAARANAATHQPLPNVSATTRAERSDATADTASTAATASTAVATSTAETESAPATAEPPINEVALAPAPPMAGPGRRPPPPPPPAPPLPPSRPSALTSAPQSAPPPALPLRGTAAREPSVQDDSAQGRSPADAPARKKRPAPLPPSQSADPSSRPAGPERAVQETSAQHQPPADTLQRKRKPAPPPPNTPAATASRRSEETAPKTPPKASPDTRPHDAPTSRAPSAATDAPARKTQPADPHAADVAKKGRKVQFGDAPLTGPTARHKGNTAGPLPPKSILLNSEKRPLPPDPKGIPSVPSLKDLGVTDPMPAQRKARDAAQKEELDLDRLAEQLLTGESPALGKSGEPLTPFEERNFNTLHGTMGPDTPSLFTDGADDWDPSLPPAPPPYAPMFEEFKRQDNVVAMARAVQALKAGIAEQGGTQQALRASMDRVVGMLAEPPASNTARFLRLFSRDKATVEKSIKLQDEVLTQLWFHVSDLHEQFQASDPAMSAPAYAKERQAFVDAQLTLALRASLADADPAARARALKRMANGNDPIWRELQSSTGPRAPHQTRGSGLDTITTMVRSAGEVQKTLLRVVSAEARNRTTTAA